MPEIMPWHQNYLLEPDYNRVDLVKEGANSQAKIKLFKSKGGTEMKPEEILKGLKPEHQTVMAEFIKSKDDAIDAAKQEAAVAKEAKEKAEEAAEVAKSIPAPEATPEEILKSVKDPAVKALLETQIAKAKVAEEEVRKSREAALSSEAIAKAKEVPNLGAEEAALADVYKKLKTLDSGVADEVFGIFKAASALVNEGGVFTEVGKSADANEIAGDENSAWNKIETKATEIAKARGISQATAIAKAIDENPELYNQYIKAQQG